MKTEEIKIVNGIFDEYSEKYKFLNELSGQEVAVIKCMIYERKFQVNQNFNWINVNDKLPENCNELLVEPTNGLFPWRSKKVVVYTDCDSISDNSRVKSIDESENWDWVMSIEGEKITHWAIFERPKK